MSSVAQVVLILVAGAVLMMLIAAFTKRGLRVTRREIIFAPPRPPSVSVSRAAKTITQATKRRAPSKRSSV